MVLLVDCVRSCGGSYGEIARKAVGEAGSFAVEASVPWQIFGHGWCDSQEFRGTPKVSRESM